MNYQSLLALVICDMCQSFSLSCYFISAHRHAFSAKQTKERSCDTVSVGIHSPTVTAYSEQHKEPDLQSRGPSCSLLLGSEMRQILLPQQKGPKYSLVFITQFLPTQYMSPDAMSIFDPAMPSISDEAASATSPASSQDSGYVGDDWPKGLGGGHWDGKDLLDLTRKGISPFRETWDVELLFREIENITQSTVVDVPCVYHGTNNFVRIQLGSDVPAPTS